MIERSVESIIQMLDADYIENGGLQRNVRGVCTVSYTHLDPKAFVNVTKTVQVDGRFYQAPID